MRAFSRAASVRRTVAFCLFRSLSRARAGNPCASSATLICSSIEPAAGLPAGAPAITLSASSPDALANFRRAGVSVGPESVLQWRHIDPERPGALHQFGPGFDPLPLATAIRAYAEQLVSAMGLPVSMAATGGEPTETERRALEEAVAATYPDCRAHDGLVLRRVSAIINRETGSALPETAYPVLYGPEVAEELAAVAAPATTTTTT